jgi:hypothetical protein
MKLTKRQIEALTKLSAEPGSAYGMRVSLGTLSALSDKQLITPTGLGHMAFPRTATWKITQAGRDALSAT